MTKLSETLGTWTNGNSELRAAYLDEGHVRIDTRDGSRVLTNREWMQRFEVIQAGGCWRK